MKLTPWLYRYKDTYQLHTEITVDILPLSENDDAHKTNESTYVYKVQWGMCVKPVGYCDIQLNGTATQYNTNIPTETAR